MAFRRCRPAAKPVRGACQHRGAAGWHLAAPLPGVRRARLHDLGRLHGPGQLGDRHRRRLALRLHAALGHPAVQPDGDPAAGARGAPRHRDRARPRAGVPRQLFAAGQHRAVARLRGGDHRLRPGRGDRHGHRAAAAVRHSADRGRPDHGARRLPAAAPDESRLPLPRGLRHRAADRDRRLLRRADRRRRAAGRRHAAGFVPSPRDRHQPRDAVCRDRHHRRDRDAAQPVPALVDRADPRLRAHRSRAAARRSAGRPPTAPSR